MRVNCKNIPRMYFVDFYWLKMYLFLPLLSAAFAGMRIFENFQDCAGSNIFRGDLQPVTLESLVFV